ncbi:MAG: nucleotidyltransferase [Elusimicrobiota bacterium]
MNLIDIFRKIVRFLNKEQIDYLLIGGIAAGVIGEPRATGDIDIDIILDKRDITNFLNKLNKAGFNFSERECMRRARESGSFQIKLNGYHIDFIIASTEIERQAMKRKKTLKVHGIKTNFPSPEDMIILKIIPGRGIDIFDAENIAKRYSGKLDEKYLIEWAQKLADEAEDLRIYNEVKRLLKL